MDEQFPKRIIVEDEGSDGWYLCELKVVDQPGDRAPICTYIIKEYYHTLESIMKEFE